MSNTEISDQIWDECLKLVDRVSKNQNSVLFRVPVDPERDGVPDYFSVITQPMDLQTVEVGHNCLETDF